MESNSQTASKCVPKDTFEAYVMWLLLVLFFIYQFIARSSFPSVLLKDFKEYFCLTAIQIGSLTGCYYFVYTFMQIPVGIIIDKFSIRLVSTVTISLCALGVFLFIATKNYYLAAFGQMLIGFGSAFAFIAVIKTITNWFPANKIAFLTAITISLGSLGPVIASPTIAYISRIYNWRSIMLVFSAAGLVLSALIWMCVKDKEVQKENSSINEKGIFDSLFLILKSPQAWILGLFTMALYAPLSSIGDLWGASFFQKAYHIDNEIAASINSMLYVGLVIGSPVFAWLAYKIESYKKTMFLASILGLASFSAILFCTMLPVSAVFVLMFLVGCASGGILTYPLGMMLFPRGISGTVTSFINMLSMVSGVILQPLIGFGMDFSRNQRVAQAVEQTPYTVSDYRLGLMAVLIFLIAGVIFALLMQDKSPKEQDKFSKEGD